MKTFEYTMVEGKAILDHLNTNGETGLSSKEAARRFVSFGSNEIHGKTVRWWQIFLRQFRSSFIYLLVGAAILSGALGERFDSVMIFLFLLINASLGFYQEFHSEKTLRLIKAFVTSHAKVVRDGEEKMIVSSTLVPGDVIVLETGDKIPADVRFLETVDLSVDETILTGESVPVRKVDRPLMRKLKDVIRASNMGFSGTVVVNGKAKAVVVATGRSSEIGKLSKLAIETKHVSSFEKGIAGFSRFVLRLVGVTLVLLFLLNIFVKSGRVQLIELVIFSVALAVSVIPEALPVVTTFSLSRGALRLAKKDVVVKRLSAIEDLGGIEILCTDKTGTLTENKLKVHEIFPQSHPDVLVYANNAASRDLKKKIEPFDIALWNALPRSEQKDVENTRILGEMPFHPETRRNTVCVEFRSSTMLISRGAPEAIMALCSLDARAKKEMYDWITVAGQRGLRVMAVAQKKVSHGEREEIERLLEKERHGFAFVGMVAFVDPIKKSATAAVQRAESLGVAIKMLTGDSPDVARAVAMRIGLASPNDLAVTGAEFEAMSASRQHEAVLQNAVFARVTPRQKHAIIQLLQEHHDVGFLGEGINDAPAIKAAGVSITVESAADITREAADIVLLKKDLHVIIEGIEEGRKVFANTMKYIRATLSSNFGNFYAVAIASLFIQYLPMLPIQILLVNLLSDFPMIAIATDTVDASELARPKKYNAKEIILMATALGIVSTVFDFIFFALFYRISPGVLQTNWFVGSIVTELLFLLSIRTRKFFLSSRPSTPIIVLVVVALAVTMALPLMRFGQNVFHFVRPTQAHFMLIALVAGAYLFCSESVKLLYYRFANRQ